MQVLRHLGNFSSTECPAAKPEFTERCGQDQSGGKCPFPRQAQRDPVGVGGWLCARAPSRCCWHSSAEAGVSLALWFPGKLGVLNFHRHLLPRPFQPCQGGDIQWCRGKGTELWGFGALSPRLNMTRAGSTSTPSSALQGAQNSVTSAQPHLVQGCSKFHLTWGSCPPDCCVAVERDSVILVWD